MKSTVMHTLAVLILVVTGAAAGQQPPREQPAPDPFAGNLFPPELIMQNQAGLSLTEQQRSAMMAEIQRTQNQAASVQWRLQANMERLGAIMHQPKIDEGQALVQLDSVLALEREMKRAQITLLVRLKNQLTAEQQAFLRGRVSSHEE
jgi:Spy/CpxP family protein refolding chaperone